MGTSGATTTMPKRWNSVDGDGDPKPGTASIKPTFYGMRRSCEPCRRRKKKCDGGQPCIRCLRTKDECAYSKRRWHLPGHQRPQYEQQQQEQQRSPSNRMHSTFGADLGRSNMLPFKRCRLSASPATGLVGMQENAFLSDFFGCIGFLPLTTTSHIRETMVKIMLTPASRQQAAFRDGDGGEAGQFDTVAKRGGSGHAFAGEELPMGPSTCIFWCAVALGALAKGSPVESVARFLQLATEALVKSYSGPADAEVAKAWAILGHLYGFMGDEAKFQKYLAMSDTFLTTSIEQGSTDGLPLGFAEIIQQRDIGDNSPRKLESIYARKQILPQLNGAASEHELYRYVMQSFHVFEKAVFARMLNHSSGAENEPLSGGEAGGEGNGERPHRNGAPQPHEISEAMAAVWSQDNLVQFGPLEEAVDRPSIRAGVGGMLINGTLVFDMACKGDVAGTFKRVSRCVEVFVRYPGLCRSLMGAHWVHLMSAALVALDVSGAREMYDKLRDVYNPFRPPGSSPVPPLEEWQGLSAICEDTYCRAIEGFIGNDKMTAFSNPADRPVPNEMGGDKGEISLDLAEQNHSRVLAADIFPEEELFISAPCSPGSSGSGFDLSNMDGTYWGLSRCSHDGTERWLESTRPQNTPTASTPRCNTPIGCNSDTEFDEVGASSDTYVEHCGTDALVGELAAPPEALSMMPQGLSEGAIEGIKEGDVAAADWLEVTYTLLNRQG